MPTSRYCTNCGAQGGKDRCGFRVVPDGKDTRARCRACEAEQQRERRAKARAAPRAEPPPIPAPESQAVRYSIADPLPPPPPASPPSDVVPGLYLGLSDVHVPFQDKHCIAAFCDYARDVRPVGLFLNGDILDLLELSSHATASVAQLEGMRVSETFDAANRFLDQIDEAVGAGCTVRRYVAGNHEDRLRRWLEHGDNSVWIGDAATSIPNRLRLAERGYIYYPNYPDAHFRLGHLLITHGRFTTKFAAATHLERYGTSVLVGHGHVPQIFYGSAFDKQRAGFMSGHMADVRSKAMSYAPLPNAWRCGYSQVYLEPSGAFHCQLINFVDGRFYANGRLYGT